MAYIRWSTKLPNRRYSRVYAWGDVSGGVRISRAQPDGKNSDPVTIALSHAEMKALAEQYLKTERLHSRRT